MIIFALTKPQIVPSIVSFPFNDLDGILRPAQFFRVVRASTLEEWRDWLISIGKQPIELPTFQGKQCKYFYELETD